jgi:signal transduction histidine kinase
MTLSYVLPIESAVDREYLALDFESLEKRNEILNASDDSIGIRLALAHNIITSQNGDIHVTSGQGKGTQCRIKLYK